MSSLARYEAQLTVQQRFRIARARARRLIQKFDPSEPRDDAGKWTNGGGGGDEAPTAFISPNVGNLNFNQAVHGLNGARHQALRKASAEVDAKLGKDPVATQNVVGAWSDGAENSLKLTMSKDWSHDQAKVALAMKGWLGDQKSALLFTPDPKGTAYIATVPMKGKLDEIHRELLDKGLAFHTLEPTSEGASVHVYGEDQATADAVNKVAIDHDTKAQFQAGHGEFIGTTKTDGTDREQRDDARRAYDAIISADQARVAFGGRDVGKIWSDLRVRWGGELAPQKQAVDPNATGAPERVSTTVPSSKKQGFDPHQRQDLSPSYDTFKQAMKNPKYSAGIEKVLDRYSKTFIRLPKGATPEQKAEAFVEHAASNLTALYNAQDPNLRGRSATWYSGARKIADDFAKQYGVSSRAVAGVMASLSPQRDWDQNVEMATRVLDIAVAKSAIPIEGAKAAKTKAAMLDYAKTQLADADKIEAKIPKDADPKDPETRGQLLKVTNRRAMAAKITKMADTFEGKKLSELPNLAEQAIVLRFYDEGNAAPGRSYAIWNPEGTKSGEVAKAGKGDKIKNKESGWGGFGMTEGALSILANDSRENISAQLGDNHKVRNFYNNIISPDYGQDTTIDTHAVAASLLRPLGGGATEVKEGLGMSGPKNAETGLKALYPLYTEAYKRAADQAGVLPREMQSTTWEALRGLFSPEEKRDAAIEKSVNDTWKSYAEGKTDLAHAQQAILARGIKPPRWAK
jgi:hypothetical protein